MKIIDVKDWILEVNRLALEEYIAHILFGLSDQDVAQHGLIQLLSMPVDFLQYLKDEHRVC
ncbi:hypothetical protein AF72_01395 [Xylella taiwanensis]|uniref:Uncharacterized protein n=1 Tax=Xylella taiwanensis TaxID=1444770 RepID=Z9JM49_9GAMM|nr:hypothetical protein AB672_04965 [Xylella taiwanensis]EWS79249.1 hypothetical protein AF72_01395 [Xylella taiwanensis]